jgi:hypothetical protein
MKVIGFIVAVRWIVRQTVDLRSAGGEGASRTARNRLGHDRDAEAGQSNTGF